MLRAIALVLLLLAVVVAGCGGDGDDDAGGSDSEPAAGGSGAYGGGTQQAGGGTAGTDDQEASQEQAKPEKKERKGTAIKLADSQFGPVLWGGDDQAIYSFDKETTKRSECYGECAVEWPPVLTKGDPQSKGGVSQGKLGTTERRDGTTQVTYNGHPLYYYFDEGPGELRCHNVPGFGGLWLALDEAGNPA